jgi:hypothetical protein
VVRKSKRITPFLLLSLLLSLTLLVYFSSPLFGDLDADAASSIEPPSRPPISGQATDMPMSVDAPSAADPTLVASVLDTPAVNANVSDASVLDVSVSVPHVSGARVAEAPDSIPRVSDVTVLDSTALDSTVTDKPIAYRYHVAGNTDLSQYEIKLAELLLAVGAEKFGPAVIDVIDTSMNSLRVRQGVQRGDKLDFHGGVNPYAVHEPLYDGIAVTTRPILNNLLGYRQLVIKKSRAQFFDEITSLEQLKTLSNGQGEWVDIVVYEANGIVVKHAQHIANLFAMLNEQRFDYVALGAIEIQDSLGDSENLEIADDIVIYYPWPYHFHVSKAAPGLYQRFEYALDIVSKNGVLDAFINKNFEQTLNRLNVKSTRVFVLDLPAGAPKLLNKAPVLLDKAQLIMQSRVSVK